MNIAMQTVFIVDDSQEVRTALSRMLGAGGYQVRSFESAERFLEEADSEAPGCLLLDICMPGMNGLDMQRSLAGSTRARPIVFLTGHGDIQSSVHAMKVGAVDFLTKPIEHKRLFAAVDQALRLDDSERRERAIRGIIQKRLEALTPRERQVMEHVIRGRLNKQISADLGIGEKTVKVHRGRVTCKLNVRAACTKNRNFRASAVPRYCCLSDRCACAPSLAAGRQLITPRTRGIRHLANPAVLPALP
jgi:FixJ family two-component response regulator